MDRRAAFAVAALPVYHADGSNPIRITHAGVLPVCTPRWSPNGSQIAYDPVQDGHSVINLIDAQGGHARLFASGRRDDMMPSWSRNGKFYLKPLGRPHRRLADLFAA